MVESLTLSVSLHWYRDGLGFTESGVDTFVTWCNKEVTFEV